jgi:hypothetical protein
MTRPTRTRLADLHRIKAWPLLSRAALSGVVHADLDLLAAKDLRGGMNATVRQLWPQDFQRLWDTARRLGWSYYWRRSVIDQFVPAVLAWSQTSIRGIDTATLDGFATALQDVTSASATPSNNGTHGCLGCASCCSSPVSSAHHPSVAQPGRASSNGWPPCRLPRSAAP